MSRLKKQRADVDNGTLNTIILISTSYEIDSVLLSDTTEHGLDVSRDRM